MNSNGTNSSFRDGQDPVPHDPPFDIELGTEGCEPESDSGGSVDDGAEEALWQSAEQELLWRLM